MKRPAFFFLLLLNLVLFSNTPKKNSDDADRLAFAVHAFMLSLGFGLIATGQAADGEGMGVLFFSSLSLFKKQQTTVARGSTSLFRLLPVPVLREKKTQTAPFDPQAPEVGPEGWQALPDGAYAFRYARAEAEAKSKPAAASTSSSKQSEKPARAMLVRASTAGDALAVAWCKEGPGNGDASSAVVPFASIVLPFGDWLLPSPSPSSGASDAPSSSSSGGDPTSRFRDLPRLEAHLKDGLERGVGLEGEKKKKKEEEEGERREEGAAAGRGGGLETRPPPPPEEQPHYPRPPPPHPVPSIGADDLYPPGLGPGMPGIAHPFPGGGIGSGGVGRGFGGVGGSQVGPDHPLFGARHPGMRPPGGGIGPGHGPPVPGLPPGARWDPIGPPGTPGFLPPQPPGLGQGRGRGTGGGPPNFHPDIMPPGPGGPFGSGSGGGGFGGGFI